MIKESATNTHTELLHQIKSTDHSGSTFYVHNIIVPQDSNLQRNIILSDVA